MSLQSTRLGVPIGEDFGESRHESERAVRDHRRKLIELATRRPELRNQILDELRKFELAKLRETALRSRNVHLERARSLYADQLAKTSG